MIKTERLLIRKFQEEDSEDLFEYLSLPETYLFEPGSPITKEQAREMAMDRSVGNNFFAVELLIEKKMIGHLYFNQSSPKDFLTWELGFIFNPKYYRKGYCTEASKHMIIFAFKEYNAHRINAYCNPMNDASWHVLENIGMKREGYFKEKAFFRKDKDNNPIWHDCYAYGIIKE